jgi:hypothetical protein
MTPRLPPAESLTVEFKSDRKRLSDNELVEAIVCLANAEGGELWLGVEDDGTPRDCRGNSCNSGWRRPDVPEIHPGQAQFSGCGENVCHEYRLPS